MDVYGDSTVCVCLYLLALKIYIYVLFFQCLKAKDIANAVMYVLSAPAHVQVNTKHLSLASKPLVIIIIIFPFFW